MTKKNRKAKNDNSPADKESAEQKLNLTESTSADAKQEAVPSQLDSGKAEAGADSPISETSEGSADEVSAEDLLDDVRRSLIEEETQADEKKPSWWGKKGKGKKDQGADVVMPDMDVVPVVASEPTKDDTEYLE